MSKRRDWTDTENLAICLAWCIMYAAQLRGEKFNKSAIRRELMGTDDAPGPLYHRSNGSIEAKLMNCSAAAAKADIAGIVKGYKPAPNYQASLVYHMREAWELVMDDMARGIDTSIDVAVA